MARNMLTCIMAGSSSCDNYNFRKMGGKMKIAVSSDGNDLASQVDPRFGRCLYFIIIETDDMSFTVYPNDNKALQSSAGIQSASFVASHDVKAVLTGNCGPKAAQVFDAARIEVVPGVSGTIQDAVREFIGSDAYARIQENPFTGDAQENRQPVQTANPGMRGSGMGGGRGGGMGGGRGGGMGGGRGGGMGGGRGCGMGGGRGGGMGGGRGRGMGAFGGNPGIPESGPFNSAVASQKSELKQLKTEKEDLLNQIKEIQSRIEKL